MAKTTRFQDLKNNVLQANLSLVENGLVTHTWGNASAVDRKSNVVIIKPSGIPYDEMGIEALVSVDLQTGKVVAGDYRPSSDLLTHLAVYRAFPEIGGIAHVHSMYAVAWAQAEREIPCMGTTHADYFYGDVPITRCLSPSEVINAYEENTGIAIVELLKERELNPLEMPGVLVSKHGPFCWGNDAASAAENAHLLEVIAKMAYLSCSLNNFAGDLPNHILEKHYQRKHGRDAYYGQSSDLKSHDGVNAVERQPEGLSLDP